MACTIHPMLCPAPRTRRVPSLVALVTVALGAPACGASSPRTTPVSAVRPSAGTAEEKVSQWRGQYGDRCYLADGPAPIAERSPEVVPLSGPQAEQGEEMWRFVLANDSDLYDCYQRGMLTNRFLSGRFVVSFAVAPNGSVVWARTNGGEAVSDLVKSCVGETICRWQFPDAKRTEVFLVDYPVSFDRAAGLSSKPQRPVQLHRVPGPR